MQGKSTYFSLTSRTFSPGEKKILFNYEVGFENAESMTFTETVLLPRALDASVVAPELIDRLLSDVHLMLGISYYKLYCPPDIRLTYKLSREQAAFWDTVYRKGLGEFAYRNNLDLRERLHFPHTDTMHSPVDIPRTERALVGIGGGKDSAVAVELLKEDGYTRDGFIVETYTSHDIARKMCDIGGISSLVIRRMLDEKVLGDLPGSYKGHIPISAVYAFLGVLAAALYDYRYVVVSNEHSSNFGNVEHAGETVNHQWSKSAEFEKLFQDYIKTNLTPSITYFSIVRPFYEIRIGELFSRYPKYSPHFTGCNRKFRIDEARRPKSMWCCECPKCAFVFLMLAPFMPRERLIGIFGKDMLDDRALMPLFADVLGFGDMKPFDCVGTFEEAQAAFFLAREQYAQSAVMQALLPRIRDGANLAKRVMRTARSLTVPTRFRLCGVDSALILGYGKEGKATQRYLKSRFPNVAVNIADESENKDYLETQDDYDIVIKTPGIPKEKIHAHYATATNIFLSRFRGTIIGVTGSKGKSTTASLIYHILSSSGVPSRLAGNIGSPMLELLGECLEPNAVVVLELSSYQLDDIEFSPHIAVVTSLFPDHMDYHGTLEKYYEAKKNILKFQKSDDIFIYNDAVPELRTWASAARGKAMPFPKLPFEPSAVPLLGEHNVGNVRAAVAAARLCGVADADIERAVRSFRGLPHRLELVGEFKGVRFYDDAISTTPESTIAALRAVPAIGTLFLGGHDRGYDFKELEAEIRARGIKNIVLFPETGKRMFRERSGLNILETSDMDEAVQFAYAHTQKGEACILSCASPSYGLWKNFEEKGDAFARAVKTLCN